MGDVRDGFASGAMRSVLLFALCGVMGFIAITSYKTAIETATLVQRVDSLKEQLSSVTITQYSRSEATSIHGLLEQRLDRLEAQKDRLENTITDMQRYYNMNRRNDMNERN